MKNALATMKGKVSLALLALSVGVLVLAPSAHAEVELKAKDFIEPVESQFGSLVVPVVGFIALVFAIGFGIRWIQKRANQAK